MVTVSEATPATASSTTENPSELLTRMSGKPSPLTSIAFTWPELGPEAKPWLGEVKTPVPSFEKT